MEALRGSNAQENGGTNLGHPHVGGLARGVGAPSIYRGAAGMELQQVRATAGARRHRGGGAVVEGHAGHHVLAVGPMAQARAHKGVLGAGSAGKAGCYRT